MLKCAISGAEGVLGKKITKTLPYKFYPFKEKIENFNEVKKWSGQFSFFKPRKNLDPSWFGFPLMINKNKNFNKNKFLRYLNINRIENRPIISGNFINQPAIKKYNIKFKKSDLKNCQEIEDRGFFIGLPTQILDKKKLNKITNLLLNVNNF